MGSGINLKTTLLAGAVLAIGLPTNAGAQTGGLIGTWKLVSASTTSADGKINAAPYGANPTGFLTYSPDGRMTAIISNGGREALSIADRITAPADERARAFATILAYGGRYTVQGGKVTHHIEIASIQNWVNGDQVRLFTLEGDHLTVLTPPDYLFNGQPQTFELKWERVK